MTKPKVLAIIPARAGSKRLKNKNFKLFCGKPLFQWVLETLISIDKIDKVIINTDARSILESHGVVNSSKILIRDRDENLCGDHPAL